MLLNIILAAIFVWYFAKYTDIPAILGLPLSVSIANIINFIWHWIDLKKHMGDFGAGKIKKSLISILVASASAAVFIKYTEGANLQAYIPQIKLLVNNSIEGLSYEKISVVLFPAHKVQTNNSFTNNSSAVNNQSSYLFIGLLLVIGIISIGGVVFFILKKK